MAKVYYSLLLNNKRIWSQVPNVVKLDVLALLKQGVADGELTSERYTEITGEAYVA